VFAIQAGRTGGDSAWLPGKRGSVKVQRADSRRSNATRPDGKISSQNQFSSGTSSIQSCTPIPYSRRTHKVTMKVTYAGQRPKSVIQVHGKQIIVTDDEQSPPAEKN
jgi:hypothetical protein